MIIFPAYAAIVWYFAYRFRRRIAGVLVVLGSALPPLVLTAVVSYANRGPQDSGLFILNNLQGYGVVLHILTVPYVLVLIAVGAIATSQHRQRPHITCPRCHYDLEGNATGQCPECGHMLPPDFIQAIAKIPSRRGDLSLPEYESDEEAAAAGERSVRRIKLPEHLVHDHPAQHDVLKHGASRARPHAEQNA